MAGWNPWRALRERPHIELRFADLDGRRGLWQRDEHGDLIVLDAALDRVARRCVLAHELVHAERGIGFPAASPATMQREEEAVRREVARRLVPAAELAHRGLRLAEPPPTVSELAEHFDVERSVIELAVSLSASSPSSRWWA